MTFSTNDRNSMSISSNSAISSPVGHDTMSSGLRDAANFHDWTFAWISDFIAGRVLDIGGGTGNHIQRLVDSELVSIDLSAACVAELREKYRTRPHWSFEIGDITDPEVVDLLGPASFDTVLSCNVFEHIPNDDVAFTHAARLLKPGGRLVLILPAHASLYGCMDRLAGHHRRYDKDLARARLLTAGLTPVHLRYVNLVGAIGWFVNNRLIRHDNLSSATINRQIRLFDRLIPLLRVLEGNRGMPFGQSLICVGQKPLSEPTDTPKATPHD